MTLNGPCRGNAVRTSKRRSLELACCDQVALRRAGRERALRPSLARCGRRPKCQRTKGSIAAQWGAAGPFFCWRKYMGSLLSQIGTLVTLTALLVLPSRAQAASSNHNPFQGIAVAGTSAD